MMNHTLPNKLFYICVVIATLFFYQISFATVVGNPSGPKAPSAPLGYVPLEPLPGISTGANNAVNLPDYLSGMFKIGIGIASVLSVLMLVVAGIQYIGGASSPSERASANSRIQNTILGLLVALGSWLLLTTIDVNLVKNTLEIEPVSIPTGDGSSGVTAVAPSGGSGAGGGGEQTSTRTISGTGASVAIDSRGFLILDQLGLPRVTGGSATIDTQTGEVTVTGPEGSALIDPNTGRPIQRRTDSAKDNDTKKPPEELPSAGDPDPCAGPGTLCAVSCPPGVSSMGRDLCSDGAVCCGIR